MNKALSERQISPDLGWAAGRCFARMFGIDLQQPFGDSASVSRVAGTILLSIFLLSGCGSGPNVFMLLEKQYWRPEDRICPDDDLPCSNDNWKTNWQIWFETEEECLASIDETQRCRNTRQ